jgi:hypothetical protein
MTGADLANLLNIAAIRASAEQLPYVPMLYLEEAYDRVAVGASRRSPMSTEEKNCTAYHEGGHTLVSIKTRGTDPIHKATILPRGSALGITWSVRDGEKHSERLFELQAHMDMIMGGRAAEELVFGRQNISAGCSSDLHKATSLAKQMVMNFGMADEQGGLSMYYEYSDYSALSDSHKNELDNRVHVLLKNAYTRALNTLKENEEELHRLADCLMSFETLDAKEIKLAIDGKKDEIQGLHDEYKAKLAKYTAEAELAAQNVTGEDKTDLEAAIALSLGRDMEAIGLDNSTSKGTDSKLALEPEGTSTDTSVLGLCALASSLLALVGRKKFHGFRKTRQDMQEPLLYA